MDTFQVFLAMFLDVFEATSVTSSHLKHLSHHLSL